MTFNDFLYDNRPDDPKAIMSFSNANLEGKALVVFGGSSGVNWEKLRDQIKPDVILGANGVSKMIKNLDYWMVSENMTRVYKLSLVPGHPEQQRSRELFGMFTEPHKAKARLISHRSWPIIHLMNDTSVCVRIRRLQIPGDTLPPNFSLRKYGEGFLFGWFTKTPGVWYPYVRPGIRVGTVAAQLIHFAGILGVKEVHTIGLDLCSKDPKKDHWYGYPKYEPDRFRTEKMFTTFGSLKTQWHWIETAEFFAGLEPFFKRDGIIWKDHSDGLLQEMKVWCS